VKEQTTSIRSLLLYVMTAVLAMATASWLASQFVGKAFSQTTPPDTQSMPAPPQGTTPVAPPAAAPVAPTAPPIPPAQAPIPSNSAMPSTEPNQATTPQSITQKSQIETLGVQGKDSIIQSSKLEPKIPEQLAGIIEDYSYTPMGKRDPFMPFEHPSNSSPQGPIWPLQKFELDQLKLVGVIWDVKTPKAMILDPSGHGYVVTVNERVGRNNGYIARIREGEIVVIENVTGTEGKTTYITKLMKLQPQ
jgi:type IV pilus assembly protein PilP